MNVCLGEGVRVCVIVRVRVCEFIRMLDCPAGHRHVIDGSFLCLLQSGTVDKRHAVITFDLYLSKFKVKDLSTTNGVSCVRLFLSVCLSVCLSVSLSLCLQFSYKYLFGQRYM
jgi:hypothetical protein